MHEQKIVEKQQQSRAEAEQEQQQSQEQSSRAAAEQSKSKEQSRAAEQQQQQSRAAARAAEAGAGAALDKQLEQKINQSIDIEDIDKQLEQITVETTQETLGPIAKQAATTTDPNKIEQKLKNIDDAYNQQMGEWNQEEQKEEQDQDLGKMKNLKKNLDILVRKKMVFRNNKKEIEKTTQEMLGPIAKDAATTPTRIK